MKYWYCDYYCKIGKIKIVAQNDCIVGVWIEGQKHFLNKIDPTDLVQNTDAQILKQAVNWLDDYFAGKKPKIEDIHLSPKGSAFQLQVWDILKGVAYGKTTTYGNIAKQIAKVNGKKMSAQAVGGAVGSNPISIIIPCHRVIGAKGNLVGYAGGLDIKKQLLQHESDSIG